MNILPKKSWHVLSRDNIQRVRRDEAEAKAKEEEKQQRAEIADREARLDLMRKRARERDGDFDGEVEEPATKKKPRLSPDAPLMTERGHINFFADIKQGVGMKSTNVDHDKEKKEEQEKYEKKIGLLNYLVDKDKSDDPWYSKSKDGEESAKSKRRKERMDPLNDMKRFISETKKHSGGSATGGTSRPPLIANPPSSSSSQLTRRGLVEQSSEKSDREERRKGDKCEKEHKSKSKHKKKKEKEREKAAQLEELRRQRRKREEAERMKAETLLRLSHGQGDRERQDSSLSQVVEDTSRRYNSQFNPHLVRQRFK